MIDPAYALAELRRSRPDVPEAALATVRRHYEQEHLTPEQAGLLAANATAKALVLTHDSVAPAQADALRSRIASAYHGPISFARDLDRF